MIRKKVKEVIFMAITTQGKLNELSTFRKTDGSIQAEYNKMNREYKKTKSVYKSSKDEYLIAKEKLEQAKEYSREASLTEMFKARRQVKMAKINLKQKKYKFQTDKENYKQKLRELRRLRSEIRNQFKTHREYTDFFKKVQKAQEMGISLPKYITDEYTRQKSIYLSEKYTVNKDGNKNYITPSDNICSKDVSSLIWEKRQQNAKEGLQNIATQIKEHLISDDEGR